MWLLVAGLIAGEVSLAAPLLPAPPVAGHHAGEIELHVPGATTDGADVLGAAWSPDDRHAATAGRDGAIRLWDVQSGVELRMLQHPQGAVAIAFSGDGKKLASAGLSELRLWDVTTGAVLRKLSTGGSILLSAVALSPDGTLLLSGECDGAITLWDLEKGTIRAQLAKNAPPLGNPYPNDMQRAMAAIEARKSLEITSLAFSADGARAVSVGSGTRLWDVQSGELLETLPLEDPSQRLLGAALSADGKSVWDLGDGLRHWTPKGGSPTSTPVALSSISAAAFSLPAGRALIGGSADHATGRALIVGLDDKGAQLATLALTSRVTAAALSRDGQRALLGELTGQVSFWDIAGGKLRRTTARSTPLQSAAVSPDGRTLVTSNANAAAAATFWDLAGGRTTGALRADQLAGPAAFTPDGRWLITGSRGVEWGLRVVDLAQAGVASSTPFAPALNAIAVSPDGKLVAIGTPTGVKLWEFAGGKLVPSANAGATGARQVTSALAFSADGAVLLASGTDRSVNVWEMSTRTLRASFRAGGPIKGAAISPDGQLGLIASTEQALWDLKAGKKVRELESGHYASNAAAFSPDGTRALFGFDDGAIVTWELASGKVVAELEGHSGGVNGLSFTRDGKRLVSAGNDGSTRFWDLATGSWVALLASPNGINDWVAITSDGYWDASRTGGDLVVATRGLDVLGVDQLAPYSNRPDLILERLGHADPQQLEQLRQLEARRLRKLGLPDKPTGELQLPTATITDARVEGKFVALSVKLEASEEAPLKSYSIFVNDVPIHGALGVPASGKSAQLSEKVELAAGNNKIEVSCLNARGLEANRAVTYAKYELPAKGNLYFVGFGVSKYKDPALNLSWADKDVRDLAALFGAMKGSAEFNEVKVKTYVNAEVEPAAFASAKAFLATATVDDTLVLFIAGHGVHDRDPAATYYFLTHGADPAHLAKSAANFEMVEEVLQGIAPRRKLFLMDTCESGELESAVEQRTSALAGLKGLSGRGLKRNAQRVSMTAAPRPYLGDRDRFLFNDLTRRSGAIVLSASGGGELSYESDAISNGFFTKAIVEALSGPAADANSDGSVSIAELRDYVTTKVSGQTGGLQNPTIDRDNIYQPFALPLAGASKGSAPSAPRTVIATSGDRYTVVEQAKARLVLDAKSGLTWRQQLGEEMSWAAAGAFCRANRDGGYDDWRLPSIDELRSILLPPFAKSGGLCRLTNACLSAGCYDMNECWGTADPAGATCQWNAEVFFHDEDCFALGVWTSSTMSGDSSKVVSVAIRGALISPADKSQFPERVACVRRTTP